MRLLHCTDFHGRADWYEWLIRESPRYDLVCLTGDLLDLNPYRSMVGQVEMVTAYLGRIGTPLAVCSGNHDSLAGDDLRLQHARWMQELRRKDVWVDGDRFEVGGFRFRCIPWLSQAVKAAPDEIWLIHSPPDRSRTGIARGGVDFGDGTFGDQCRAGDGPRLALSGHVHDPQSWWVRSGCTWSLNPGVAEDEASPRHIAIDLGRDVATWHGGPGGLDQLNLD